MRAAGISSVCSRRPRRSSPRRRHHLQLAARLLIGQQRWLGRASLPRSSDQLDQRSGGGVELADRWRDLLRRLATTHESGHRHKPLVTVRPWVGQLDDDRAPRLVVPRLACRVGHRNRRNADFGAQGQRGQDQEMKSGNARLDLLERRGGEACEERKVAH
jgi:hypothetical protein